MDIRTETTATGPDNLGFIFNESELPPDPGSDLLELLKTIKSNIAEVFRSTAETATQRLDQEIKDGKISQSDTFGQQSFLATAQYNIFINAPWFHKDIGGGGQSRDGTFPLASFNVEWLLLDLNPVPFSTSPNLRDMLKEFGGFIKEKLDVGVVQKGGWATAEVNFTIGDTYNTQQKLLTEVRAGYLQVTANKTVREEPGRFPWSPPTEVEYVSLSSVPSVINFKFDNAKWEESN